jgi:hypothetical protein
MLDSKFLGHASNLAHKRRIAETPSVLKLLAEVEKEYAIFVAALKWSSCKPGWLASPVSALNSYTDIIKDIEKADSFFNWRSDFASSLLPEFLVRILYQRLSHSKISPLFSTRDSIVDVTLSGYRDGGWTVRHKNQDLCIGLRTDRILLENAELEFVVPLIAVEAKTNIDINKLNGLDFSAERLKRTFPSSRYFLVTETLDYSLKRNYSGSIDEIYVLRKQMRHKARKSKAVYCSDVFESFAEDVHHYVAKADLSKRHVYDRLIGGRLINV